MIKPALSILFFILIAPVLAIAEEPGLGKQSIENDAAFYELKSAKSIECYFPQGSFANWRGQSMKLEEDHISNAIHFDNIDTSNKKQARMIAKLGATDVRAFMSPSGITFIEVTDTGNFIYTTVFPSYLGDKKINSEPQKDTFLFQKAYIAVTSRHIYAPIIGAMPSQLHGYCRILE
ncbi:TPA: hypothetical protein ACHW7I_002947 [Legionella pneumophila]|nr:hypothetical protein [Legionella pneumophila]AMV15243.1 hypothetical protein ULM_25830 [Legionella pneumophila]ANN93400.1 hypothetical protein A9P85_12520 [Legionella pneumophila]MCH9157709.1 hypothetical protein [Legionella pneumophila serogroup 1]MCK1849010.1 hypothetical protein [Legionella pneumophila]MCZ4703902.1 hypothetical protein [Legionella pneumophila]